VKEKRTKRFACRGTESLWTSRERKRRRRSGGERLRRLPRFSSSPSSCSVPALLVLLLVSVELFIASLRRHPPSLPPPASTSRTACPPSPPLRSLRMRCRGRTARSLPLPGAISSAAIGRGKGGEAVLFCQPSATLRKGAFLFSSSSSSSTPRRCLLPRTAVHSTCRSSRLPMTSPYLLARRRREGVRNRRKGREEEGRVESQRGGGIASTSRANRCVSPLLPRHRC
jgi:hypothetical protein